MRFEGVRLPALGWRVLVRLLLACVTLLPVWGFLKGDTSITSRLFVGGLFFGALLRPADTLLVLAGLLILAEPLGAVSHAAFPLAEPMVLAFLGGWLLRGAARHDDLSGAQRSVLAPALLLAGAFAASVLTQLLVTRAMEDFYWPYFRGVFAYLGGEYAAFPNGLPAVNAGAPMLEGIALFAAVVTLGRTPLLAYRAARLATAGAAGLATLNITRYLFAWISNGPQPAAWLRGVRISILADYNAVGSYLAMMLLVAVGLAVAERRARVAWLAVAVLILAATWLTRSRAALLAIPVGALCFFGSLVRVRLRPVWRTPAVAVLALTLVLLVALVAWFKAPDSGQRVEAGSASANLYGRWQMAQVSLQMFQSSPLFGVGVGRYWGLSGAYIPPSLRVRIPNENAHNNFLQILAELGAIGLVLFLWVLAAAARRVSLGIARERSLILAAVSAGLTAFLLSCLAGHPLLVRHASYAFWLMLGIAVALACSATDDGAANRSRRQRVVIATVLICLVVSAPLRADRLLRTEANLSRVSIGFTPWQSDESGTRYRTMTGRAEFYVSADAEFIRLPVRAVDERKVVVDVLFDGALANRVSATSQEWVDIRMILPRTAKRFYRIELRTAPGVVLRTGETALQTRRDARD